VRAAKEVRDADFMSADACSAPLAEETSQGVQALFPFNVRHRDDDMMLASLLRCPQSAYRRKRCANVHAHDNTTELISLPRVRRVPS